MPVCLGLVRYIFMYISIPRMLFIVVISFVRDFGRAVFIYFVVIALYIVLLR